MSRRVDRWRWSGRVEPRFMKIYITLPDEDSFTVKETARMLGVHISTTWRYILRGIRGHKLRAIRLEGGGGCCAAISRPFSRISTPPTTRSTNRFVVSMRNPKPGRQTACWRRCGGGAVSQAVHGHRHTIHEENAMKGTDQAATMAATTGVGNSTASASTTTEAVGRPASSRRGTHPL